MCACCLSPLSALRSRRFCLCVPSASTQSWRFRCRQVVARSAGAIGRERDLLGRQRVRSFSHCLGGHANPSASVRLCVKAPSHVRRASGARSVCPASSSSFVLSRARDSASARAAAVVAGVFARFSPPLSSCASAFSRFAWCSICRSLPAAVVAVVRFRRAHVASCRLVLPRVPCSPSS